MLLFQFEFMRNCRLKLQVKTDQNGWKNHCKLHWFCLLVWTAVNCRWRFLGKLLVSLWTFVCQKSNFFIAAPFLTRIVKHPPFILFVKPINSFTTYTTSRISFYSKKGTWNEEITFQIGHSSARILYNHPIKETDLYFWRFLGIIPLRKHIYKGSSDCLRQT